MNNSKVSILMSAFNSENFISKSIESVINQSYSNYERIIVDDGSNDSTKEIIKMYSHNNSKIKLFSKSNSGITESLNYGLSFCQGECIARLDSDDLCHVERLKKQINLAESSKKIGLVGSDAIFINKLDQNLFYFSYPTTHNDLKNNLLSCSKFFPHSSAFYNRKLIESLGGYRKRAGMSEDWDLWLRIADKKEMKNINQPLVKIRIHDDQVSNKNHLQHAYDTRTVIIANILNKRKKYDPIEIFTDIEFCKFKLYISQNLEEFGFKEFINFKSIYKNPLIKIFALPFIFLKYLIRPFYLYSFTRLNFFPKSININVAENFHKNYINNEM